MIINLFKHRHLAFGCCGFLIMLYTCFYIDTLSSIFIGIGVMIIALAFGFIHARKKSKVTLNLLTKSCSVLFFVILAIFISSFTFQKDKRIYEYCDGNVYEIEGQVDTVLFNYEYYAGYNVNITKINGVKCNYTVTMTDDLGALKGRDYFKANAVFSALQNKEVGFDTASYYISDGILVEGEVTEYFDITEGKPTFIDTLRGINTYLNDILMKIFSERVYPFVSSLLLGNRNLLSYETTRDFTRLGIVHILSLSGMHVSIIVSIIGFALSKTYLPSSVQFILTSVIIVLFVGISGFSEPAIRAGLMQLIFFATYICWKFPDKISALFLSVTLICVFSPYLIFSIGLLLSFFAMLSCMLSARLIYKTKIMKKFKGKFARFCFLTFVSTTTICLFCLPITYLYFGSFSLISAVTNIFLVPIINIVIYLVPFILILLPIHFISDVLIYFCEVICNFVLDISGVMADMENLLLPIISDVQFVGAMLLFASILLIFILPRKKLKVVLWVLGISLLVFFSGTVALFIDRNNNDYITAYSYNNNDVICIEEENELTLIDISNHSKSSVFSMDMSRYLGYGEVERYVILTYSHKSSGYFEKMTGTVLIRNVFLAKPQNKTERIYFDECVKFLENKNISYSVFDYQVTLGSFTLELSEDMYINRSTKRCVVFSLNKNDFKYSYFGASSNEVNTYEVARKAYESDILVFGSYGPNFKTEFSYKMANMEHCIFMGDSKSYAKSDFLDKIESKFITNSPFKIRIRN